MKRRPFNGYCLFDRYCIENGRRRRLRGQEIEEAFRLYERHHKRFAKQHVEESKRWGSLPMGEKP